MTKEERQKYDKWYNESGYKKKPNRRYYMKNREKILEKAKARKESEKMKLNTKLQA